MKKSVLHLSIQSPGYDTSAMIKAWGELGYEVTTFHWQQYKFNNGAEALQPEVLRLAKEKDYEIIFCHIQNPEAFNLDFWKELSNYGFVINYSFDVRSKEETKWMYDTAPHIGLTVFACYDDVEHCQERGIENVCHSHSSCDMEVFKPNGKKLYAFDVTFCGNKYTDTNLNFPLAQERQDMIAFLEKEYPANFMSYGLGQKGGPIIAGVEANVYNFSRIAIVQNNFERQNYTSDRLWRIMATGTMCLCKWFPGIEDVFQKEIHLDTWRNFDELNGLIKFYLSDEKERLSIAEVGCNLVRENHRWVDRFAEIEKKVAQFQKIPTFEA